MGSRLREGLLRYRLVSYHRVSGPVLPPYTLTYTTRLICPIVTRIVALGD